MKKYGIEHFHIELIEETDNTEEMENENQLMDIIGNIFNISSLKRKYLFKPCV